MTLERVVAKTGAVDCSWQITERAIKCWSVRRWESFFLLVAGARVAESRSGPIPRVC